jgi:hypothetical protein
MPGYIFISKTKLLLIAFLVLTTISAERGQERTLTSEEDDFAPTPFTEYGEYNEEAEETEDAKFFQHGRFFGVSVGSGYHGVTGNRGILWQGGKPMFELKLHYWFDFNVALDLGFFTAPHFYEASSQGNHVDVGYTFIGVHAKYYFDTRNVSAPITFANPYILAGGGQISKTETSISDNATTTDSNVGIEFGGGMEFALKPRKLYFAVEGKGSIVSFEDTYTERFESLGASDLTGMFFSLTAALMFTW